ncbi:MAG: protein-ADP-ribose hydrolase [bacterium]
MKEELEVYLIEYLLDELNQSVDLSGIDKFRLFRGLVNKRSPKEVSKEFIIKQDEYLQLLLKERGIIDYSSHTKMKDNVYLIQGDITSINTDCIVNAANSALLGCFYPNHGCIDNAIHTFSGVQLRLECNELMQQQGFNEKTGYAKITNAYNLPCKKVIHTVGPIVYSNLTEDLKNDLRNCYKNVLKLAVENGMKSISICCISTGEFCFPNEEAAKIAVEEVEYFLESNTIDVVFNVFKDVDYEIYRRILKN